MVGTEEQEFESLSPSEILNVWQSHLAQENPNDPIQARLNELIEAIGGKPIYQAAKERYEMARRGVAKDRAADSLTNVLRPHINQLLKEGFQKEELTAPPPKESRPEL
ncbi:hypothetical protein HYU92_05605 [Candidatus Curtissbacteria bacterium]|nr:hypothetical protein [Candidatus Curtissbacteria bacterium]